MSVFSGFSLHNIKKIHAHTYAELASAPLTIAFSGDESLAGGWSEITIHTDNPELASALVKAINDTVETVTRNQAQPHAEAA